MPYPRVVKRLIDGFRTRRPMRTTSLIITVFGDVVSQHGNSIWLGSLVEALAPLGVKERLVRTSVFRLVKEGWLESQRAGRRSYYRFSDYGAHEYGRAAPRIYGEDMGNWNGCWQLLIPRDVPEETAERFKRSLHWQGFRTISAGVFAKPGPGGSAMRESLAEFEVLDKVLLMEADAMPQTSPQLLLDLVHKSWQMDEVARGYKVFQARFKPLRQWLDAEGAELSPKAAFAARVLLIHDYRRILLKDPQLPRQLLPRKWPGDDARDLTAAAYRRLMPASVAHITATLESDSGLVPAPGRDFARRFRRSR